MRALVKRPLSDEAGAITIERGLLAALILLAAFSVLSVMGVPLDTLYSDVFDRPASGMITPALPGR